MEQQKRKDPRSFASKLDFSGHQETENTFLYELTVTFEAKPTQGQRSKTESHMLTILVELV